MIIVLKHYIPFLAGSKKHALLYQAGVISYSRMQIILHETLKITLCNLRAQSYYLLSLCTENDLRHTHRVQQHIAKTNTQQFSFMCVNTQIKHFEKNIVNVHLHVRNNFHYSSVYCSVASSYKKVSNTVEFSKFFYLAISKDKEI